MRKMRDEMPAFDLDGVVFDSATPAHEIMMAELGIDFMGRVNRFDTCLLLPDTMGKDEKTRYVLDMWNRAVPLAKPYEGAVEALREYALATGRPLYFLTARVSSMEEITRDMLSRLLFDIPWEITFRDCGDKCDHLRSRGFTTIVEDRLRTANEVAGRMGRAFLVDRPWNRGRDVAPGVVRIRGIGDLVTMWQAEAA